MLTVQREPSPMSILTRQLFTNTLVLLAFIALTGMALESAFRESAERLTRERLQSQVYQLLGAIGDFAADERLTLPEGLAEPRFATPGSDLYGAITDASGQVRWRSRSTLGLRLSFPADGEPNTRRVLVLEAPGETLLAFGHTVRWELNSEHSQLLTFWVAEPQQRTLRAIADFRHSLWTRLLIAAVLLLGLQALLLQWSLRPLHHVAQQLRQIDSGEREQVTGPMPRELRTLTEAINALLVQNRGRLQRSRNALGDLAHSLKTPLAVLDSTLAHRPETLASTVEEQSRRMRQTIEYQLQRAAAAGRSALAGTVDLPLLLDGLLRAFVKLHAGHTGLEITQQIETPLALRADEGDLNEILGNLIDNACKWAQQRVHIRAERGNGVVKLCIEDDGPGFAQDNPAIARGQRHDAQTDGHGLGLAFVCDLVEELYGGTLHIERSVQLGGACVTVLLPD